MRVADVAVSREARVAGAEVGVHLPVVDAVGVRVAVVGLQAGLFYAEDAVATEARPAAAAVAARAGVVLALGVHVAHQRGLAAVCGRRHAAAAVAREASRAAALRRLVRARLDALGRRVAAQARTRRLTCARKRRPLSLRPGSGISV